MLASLIQLTDVDSGKGDVLPVKVIIAALLT